jgi:hypothetical protein
VTTLLLLPSLQQNKEGRGNDNATITFFAEEETTTLMSLLSSQQNNKDGGGNITLAITFFATKQ